MSFRRFIALSLLSVGPSLLGCETAYPRSKDGALAIRVHPSIGSPRAAPARGSFSLRGIDAAQRKRIVLAGDAYQTLHVPLPAGAYAVQWEPAEGPALRVDPHAIEAGAEPPRIVVVAPGQLTLIDVSTTTPSELGVTAAALASNALTSRLALSK